ncbi:ABC transporter substrate-binding protein [Plantactinospora sp. CA-294935]|uniref:ABC transporter substrate-binding protein n=1 Tax=Plantactinospora sp. CA-294935 TaxID=3240012 RepID=UPI003D8CAE12
MWNFDRWVGDKPRLERLEFKVIPDSQARVDALNNGEIDLIGGPYLAPITPVEAKSLDGRDDVELLTGAPDVSIMLGFNPDGPAGDKAPTSGRRQGDRHRRDAVPGLRRAGPAGVPAGCAGTDKA